MTTLEAIQMKIKKLQAQAEAIAAKQTSNVLANIRDLMDKHGLTIADIEAHIGGKKRGRKAGVKTAGKPGATAAKYLDPKTGATWTGHGRAPAWIANVKDRSKFLIASGADTALAASAGDVSKSKSAVKKASAAAGATAHKGQPKGPQPALYRDPKSGATWSGRGRAPAWLATAKDRSKFLIDGAGAVAAESAVASKTKQATKKAARGAKRASAKAVKTTTAPAVKKAAAKKAVSAKVDAPKSAASKKAPGKRAAPTVKKTAKKALATKAVVANDVVAKADVAATPEGLVAPATA